MDGWPAVFRFGRVEIVPTDEHETASTVSPKANTTSNATGTPRRRVRRSWAIAAAAVLAVAVLIYWLHSRRFESTDDAQVDGNISGIGARVGGTVTRVGVIENQVVKVGDLLLELDPTDLEVAAAQAKAAVAQAVAQLEAEDPTVAITETSNTAAVANASSELAVGLGRCERGRARRGAAHRALTAGRARNARLRRARAQARRGAFAEGGASARRCWIAGSTRPRRRPPTCAPSAGARRGARRGCDSSRRMLGATQSRLSEVQKTPPSRSRPAGPAWCRARRISSWPARSCSQAELNLGYTRWCARWRASWPRRPSTVGDHVAPGQQLFAIAQTSDALGDRQLPRDPAPATCTRGSRPCARRRDRRRLRGHVDSLGGATGSRLQPAAARERDRQLREGGAAHPGAHSLRRPGKPASNACAPACRSSPRCASVSAAGADGGEPAAYDTGWTGPQPVG